MATQRDLTVRLRLDGQDRLRTGMRRTSESVRRFGDGVDRAGERLKSFGERLGNMRGRLVAAGAAFAGVSLVVRNIVRNSRELGTWSARLGVAADELYRLTSAFELMGAELEDGYQAIKNFQEAIADTAKESAFLELGLEQSALRVMGVTEAYQLFNDRILALGDTATQTRIRLEVMSEEGIKATGAGLADFRREIELTSGSFESLAESSSRFVRMMQRVKTATTGVISDLGLINAVSQAGEFTAAGFGAVGGRGGRGNVIDRFFRILGSYTVSDFRSNLPSSDRQPGTRDRGFSGRIADALIAAGRRTAASVVDSGASPIRQFAPAGLASLRELLTPRSYYTPGPAAPGGPASGLARDPRLANQVIRRTFLGAGAATPGGRGAPVTWLEGNKLIPLTEQVVAALEGTISTSISFE